MYLDQVTEIETLLQRSQDFFDKIMQGLQPSLSTGYLELDRITHGFFPGELIIVAGRPCMGTTSFVLKVVEKIALDDKMSVLVKSCDLTDQAILQRLLCSRAKINKDMLYRGFISNRDSEKYLEASEELLQSEMVIADNIDRTFEKLESMALFMKQQNGLRLLVVDCLDLFVPTGNRISSRNYFRSIMIKLKNLAANLNIVVLCTTTLGRHAESPAPPRLSDLRYDEIATRADTVLLIHRPGLYYSDEWSNSDEDLTDIVIAKNRKGRSGCSIRLSWIGEWMRFEEVTHATDEHSCPAEFLPDASFDVF